MIGIPAWLIAFVAAAAGAALGGGVQQLRIASLNAEYARYETKVERDRSAAWEAVGKARDDLETERAAKSALTKGLDERLSKEREDAYKQAESDLRGIAVGTVRVRYVAAQCPAAGGSGVPAAAGAAGLADAAGIELSPKAGVDVQLLRQSIRDDRAQIEGLKEYIGIITGSAAQVRD